MSFWRTFFIYVGEKNVEEEKFPKTIRYAAMGCRKGVCQPISMRIKPGLYFVLPVSIFKSYLALHIVSGGYN